MAYRGYKVVCFTPSGRKRTQSVLIDNLRRFTHIVDEYQIWLNTDEEQVDDVEWLRQQPDNYPWVKLVELPKEKYAIKPKQLRTGLFYARNTVDPETIYIRFDDDILYIDDDFFVNLLDFRIDNPDYFLVMANIWNNAMISYIHQQLGNIPLKPYVVEEPYCMDPVGWQNGKFAEQIHRILLEHIEAGSCQELFFDRAELSDACRFSISCFCFFGKDFAEFDGVVGQRREGIVRYDEEVWLTEVYPTLKDKKNVICGSALVAHYTFFAQRPYIDTTDILERYRDIGKKKLSASYYELLDNGTPVRKHELGELPTVTLPKSNYSSLVSDAIKAERNGYTVQALANRVEIIKDGQVKKTIIGTDIAESSIDEALAFAYRS